MAKDYINWAIVGTGDIVRKRAGAAIAAQPHSRIYACVVTSIERHRDTLTQLAPEKTYTDLGEALADEKIDAVYVATPVDLHASQAIAAMTAGKDVLLEKPMARTLDEARKICQVAADSKRRLAVAYYRRHWTRFQRATDALNRGELGQVTSVDVTMRSWYRIPAAERGSWRVDPRRSGGGVLADVGCHKFDLLAWWFGMPERLVSYVATRTHDFPAEDSASLLMTLQDGAPVTAAFHWNCKPWTDEMHIVGSDASLTYRPSDGEEILLTRGSTTEVLQIPPPKNLHYPLVDDFAKAIVIGRSPRFSAEDGLAANLLLDAVYRSSESHSWTKVPS